MNDREILDRLWEAYRETPFASLMMQRKLDLRHDELTAVLNLINDMADSGEVQSGYRIKRVASAVLKMTKAQAASTAHKVTQAQPSDSDSLKGKPLIKENEAVLGQSERNSLSTDAENHNSGRNDPLPAVPAEIKAKTQWVVWRAEKRDGKPTKIPYQVNQRKAQTNLGDTWTDYQTVCNHLDNFSGIGFVFSAHDPYCGIDLDNCIDDRGNIQAWAEPIVDRLKAICYGEVSPSGKGIKFWTRAKLPNGAKHKVYLDEGAGEAIEAYDRGRYFTVTGRGKGDIGDGQQVIDWLVAEYLTPTPEAPSAPRAAPTSSNLSADEVIAKIRESKQCHTFDVLFAGNTTDYGSQSEADFALCSVVAFWTQDPAVIDAIFRQSALMRPKWDETRGDTTYGFFSIDKALSKLSETYTAREERSTTQRHVRRERYGYDRF